MKLLEYMLYPFLGVRCLLSTIMYMVHAWSTNHAVGEATDDVKIGTNMGKNIYQ